jgi:hypothetical protein
MPSTAIRYFRYNSAKRELQVTFVTGRRYVYADVPPDIADAFRAALSKGTFFNREIRDRYAYREVAREDSYQPRQALTESDAPEEAGTACACRWIICSMKLYEDVAELDAAAADVIVTFEPSA